MFYPPYRHDPDAASTELHLEYRVEGLRPATAYALRLAAVNAIGDSDYSEPVIVQTLEEGNKTLVQYLKC